MIGENQSFERKCSDYLLLFGSENLDRAQFPDQYIGDDRFERSFKIAHPAVIAWRANGTRDEFYFSALVSDVFISRDDSFVADITLVGRE